MQKMPNSNGAVRPEDILKLYRHDFHSFACFAFRELHPDLHFKDNWHLRLMAHQLTQCSKGGLRRLLMNAPPHPLHTFLSSIALPAWVLGRDPRQCILLATESKSLADEFQEQCIALMRTPRYRALFPQTEPKALAANGILLNHGGGLSAIKLGQKAKRENDLIVVESPQSSVQITDEAYHGACKLAFQSLYGFLKTPQSPIVLSMSRLHEKDLCGYLSSHSKDWTCLSLPAIATEAESWQFPLGQTFKRRKGELLHQDEKGFETLCQHLENLGGEDFCWQYLQGRYQPDAHKSEVNMTRNADGGGTMSISILDSTEVTRRYLEEMEAGLAG